MFPCLTNIDDTVVGLLTMLTCRFSELSTKLLASSQISVHPPKVGKHGLEGVFDGLQQLKEGKVSGTKLVYQVDQTP